MKPLREAFINKNNLHKVSTAAQCYVVWPIGKDFKYIMQHPHWYEVTLKFEDAVYAGKVFVFREKEFKKDFPNFKDINTTILTCSLSIDEILIELENFKVNSDNINLEKIKGLKSYTLEEFKKIYK